MKKNTKKSVSKKSSTKVERPIIVAVSGGFDPIHIGHVRMFNEAKKLGDKLVVILNNDNWIKKKKGAPFMPDYERKEVIEALSSVDEVILTSHSENPDDMSVRAELEKIRPHIFANGGDRTVQDSQKVSSSLSPEAVLCETVGIKMVFNIGHGGKVQSSSWLLKRFKENHKR
ncbi:MAG: adenylyltransferase/cytidyltransferase family protein [bacterium]|nr:adenylyltransferase/cytidyltransferase family protein [bacterium]